MTGCEHESVEMLWDMASELWEKAMKRPLVPTFGGIMACGTYVVGTTDTPNVAGSRLRRILVSETAHLIWKVRCDRVINDREPSMKTIRKRWTNTMNSRLELDKIMANKSKYGSKANPPKLVLRTWDGTLANEGELPDNWIRERGVSVGVE